jgi:hypothetical protein
MTKNHLLYWILKAVETNDPEVLRFTEEDFRQIKAPSWAWQSYQDSMNDFDMIEKMK